PRSPARSRSRAGSGAGSRSRSGARGARPARTGTSAARRAAASPRTGSATTTAASAPCAGTRPRCRGSGSRRPPPPPRRRPRLALGDGPGGLLRHQRREARVVAERPFDVVRPAHRVDRAVAARDRAERRLALAQPQLVAPVDAFAVRPVLALEPDLAADVGDV